MTDREEKIRERAHRMWEEEGRPEGRAADHWQRAAREVEGRSQDRSSARAKVESAAPSQPGLPDIGDSPSLQPADTAPADKPRRRKAADGTTTTRKRAVKG